ncbi:MAG: carbohydrate ABC transporter permease [Fibrobacter sp.]|jgi:multiple sugar transport system permease protein|nr:carbohydrate ABC transporter permease [Fibrobacter sp.]
MISVTPKRMPMTSGKKMIWATGIILAVLIVAGPVYLLVKYSISDIKSINTGGEPIPWWPFEPTMQAFLYLFRDHHFYQVLLNSVIVAFSTVVLSLILGVPAAYILGRYRIPGRKLLLLGIISVRLFPDIASVIPVVEFFIHIGAHQTYWGVILAHTLLALPYVIFIGIGAFESIPADLEQQAWVMGAGTGQTFFRILLPLAIPGLAAAAIYTFLLSWDEFIFAYFLMLGNQEIFTLTLYLNGIKYAEPQNLLAAISVCLSVPVIIFSLMVQRYMIAGISTGSVK